MRSRAKSHLPSGFPARTGKLLVNLLTEDHSHADERGRHTLMLEGYGYRWYRVGGLDYLLKRSDIDTDAQRQDQSPGLSRLPEDHALIAAQIERAVDLFTLAGRGMSTAGFRRPKPIELEATETGSAPRFNAMTTTPPSSSPAIKQDISLSRDRPIGALLQVAAISFGA